MDLYESTTVKACFMLGMKTAGSGYSSKITLLRMSGAVIPNKWPNVDNWHAFSTGSDPSNVDKVIFTYVD